MFDLRGDYMGVAATVLKVSAFECVVGRFAAAAGEDDLRRFTTEQVRYLCPSFC
jgi:hypothetical protein